MLWVKHALRILAQSDQRRPIKSLSVDHPAVASAGDEIDQAVAERPLVALKASTPLREVNDISARDHAKCAVP